MKLASDFWQSKTTWTSIGVIVTTFWAAFHHQISWNEAAGAIFGALQLINVRDTVAKAAAK